MAENRTFISDAKYDLSFIWTRGKYLEFAYKNQVTLKFLIGPLRVKFPACISHYCYIPADLVVRVRMQDSHHHSPGSISGQTVPFLQFHHQPPRLQAFSWAEVRRSFPAATCSTTLKQEHLTFFFKKGIENTDQNEKSSLFCQLYYDVT